jgi:hypothetical protein
MRIEVIKSGGFAGIEHRAALDTNGRPDAFRLHALARDVLAADRGGQAGGVPDGFQFDITIDGRCVRCFEPRISEAQNELISIVLKEGS